jgi:carboxypeptidase Q
MGNLETYPLRLASIARGDLVLKLNHNLSMKNNLIFFLIALLCAGAAVAATESEIQQESQQIAGSVLVGGHALDTLQTLTDSFGPRVTGSSNYNRAVQWAAEQFRSYGIKDVKLEPFTMANGWERGPVRASMIAPFQHSLHLEAFGWTPSTPAGGVRGELVLLKDITTEGIKAQTESLKGRIVLIDSKSLFKDRSPKNFELIERSPALLAKAGAAAVLMVASLPNNVISTGDLGWRGEVGPLVMASVGLEDGRMLMRRLEKGPVSVEFEYQNKVTGPEQVNDVVAEIRGMEKPDEWVLIGAHLDSWDFATGAQDNGSGTAQVLEAARAIAAQGKPPKRSIRFALWGGEEEGLVGSIAYAQEHAGEMAKCVAALNTDNGAGHPKGWKVQGRKDVETALEPLSKSLLSQLGGEEISQEISFDTDHGPFMLYGVPALDLLVDDGDYEQVHHKPADTFDKVDDHGLADGAAIVAVTAWALANADQPFAKHLDHAAEGEILKKDGLDEYLEAQGLWK